MILACLASFFLGVICTMWALHRLGVYMQRKAQEEQANEITRQIIRQAIQQN